MRSHSPAAAYHYLRRKRQHGVKVAYLPSAATVGRGHQLFVTDAVDKTAGVTVTGGGAYRVAVRSDRTNWKVV